METKKDLAIDLRREYHREWRRKNKDKVAEYNERYWLKKAEKKECEKHAL